MVGRLKVGCVVVLTPGLGLLTGCSSTPTSPALEVEADPSDPFENVNRKIYSFNSTVDKNVLLPVANAYGSVTPDIIERGVSNFFSNLSDVGNFLNHSLQFKPKKAGKDAGRLVINTTLGLGGIVDVASGLGIYQESEDFGQTLGYWGVNSGPYVVLPFFGPSTVRDASASFLVDMKVSPINRYNPQAHQFYISALQVVDLRYRLGDYESMASGDTYVFIREAYLQRREHMINDGVSSEDDSFDDF